MSVKTMETVEIVKNKKIIKAPQNTNLVKAVKIVKLSIGIIDKLITVIILRSLRGLFWGRKDVSH
jgi:hypothetical protein